MATAPSARDAPGNVIACVALVARAVNRCLFLTTLTLLSCAASRPPVGRPPAAAAHAHPPHSQSTPAEDEWAALSWEERHNTMTWSVLPAMMPVFKKSLRH